MTLLSEPVSTIGQGSRRRVDPTVLLVAAGTFVIYVLHGFNGYFGRDPGVYAYAGEQVADGVPPYVGIVNRAGPLAHMLPAVGAAMGRLTGKDELLCMRFFFMLLGVAAVCVAYAAARDLFASKIAGIATAAAFLTFTGCIEAATTGPDEKTAMMLFLLCALWAVVRSSWLVAGVFVSLATLVLQTAFFVGLPVLLVAALTQPRGSRLRAMGRGILGGVLPALVLVAYFAVAGAVDALLNGFLLLNARYTPGQPATDHPELVWENLWEGLGAGAAVALVGPVVVVALGVVALRPRLREQWPWLRMMLALGAGVLGGVLWTFKDYDGWADSFPLLPLAVLGIGAVARLVLDRVAVRAVVPVLAAWVAFGLFVSLSYSIGARDDALVRQRASVAKMMARLPADATMLSLAAPQPLVLTDLKNPTRHQMFTNGLYRYVEDTWPGGLSGFTEWILEQRPTVVVVGDSTVSRWDRDLQSEYARVGCSAGWKWYVDRSLGARTLAELRRVNATVRPPVTTGSCGPVRTRS